MMLQDRRNFNKLWHRNFTLTMQAKPPSASSWLSSPPRSASVGNERCRITADEAASMPPTRSIAGDDAAPSYRHCLRAAPAASAADRLRHQRRFDGAIGHGYGRLRHRLSADCPKRLCANTGATTSWRRARGARSISWPARSFSLAWLVGDEGGWPTGLADPVSKSPKLGQ